MNELQQAQKDLVLMKAHYDAVASIVDHSTGNDGLDHIMSQILQQESYVDDLIEWGMVDYEEEIDLAWQGRGVLLNPQGIYV